MKPWLWVSPKLAHRWATLGVRIYALFSSGKTCQWQSLNWRGLQFPNPMGIAGGVDKDAANIMDWKKLGVGFVEIGTVTPRPQTPNPGAIVDRSIGHSALWNKMGFPGVGVAAVKRKLEKLDPKHRPIIFLNVGKNRDTTNKMASQDYVQVMGELENYVDAFVVNISSPNTTGLRDLLKPENLKAFLDQILVPQKRKLPLLLKLSPDMSENELTSAIDTALNCGIAGFVISNTMINQKIVFPQHDGGGVSGKPLCERSRALLKVASETLKRKDSKALLVSVGGVMDYKEVKTRLDLGAHLVQVYSAIVFEGPGFFRTVGQQFAAEHLQEARCP